MSINFVLTLKEIIGRSILVFSGSKKHRNEALNVEDHIIFSWFANIEWYHSALRIILTTSSMWYAVGYFVQIIVRWLYIDLFCLIWLNVDLFSWRFDIKIFFSLRTFVTWILMEVPLVCWIYIDSITCGTVVQYFLQILIIDTLVFSCRESAVSWEIFFKTKDIGHFVMLTLLKHYPNGITSQWKF